MLDRERKTDRQEAIPQFLQSAIHNAKVAVIGAGATGNECLKSMALTGFGYVYIADMDYISTSNLSRTVLFTEDDIGKRKAATAAERFCMMNIDNGTADVFDGDLCHGMGEGVIRHVDFVIGCVDNEQTRLYVSNICQLLQKPYIDTGIGGFNWNVFAASGQEGCACYACTMSQKQEERALNRIRNSCDVTRRQASAHGHVPTIGVSAGASGSLAIQEAIKIGHHLSIPDSGLPAPRYGWMSCFTAEENQLCNVYFPVRSSCQHHDNYDNHGGVHETPMSARWKLKDVLSWVKEKYGKDYGIALYKDNVCADRGFVTKAFCKCCGTEIDVYRPQPFQDEELLCETCRVAGKLPMMPSNATLKNWFDAMDEKRLLEMSLLELGIPLLHIVEFAPIDEQSESLYLELTGDLKEVMPRLPQ